MVLAVATGTLALGAGTALALGAAVVVLGPLWAENADEPLPIFPPDESRIALGASAPSVGGVSAIEALREIEFDRATGKLSDEDYAGLKATYTREALAELRAADAGTTITAPEGVDPVEAALIAYRARQGIAPERVHAEPGACIVCGPRPESDAEFCSNCGRFLAAECPVCHAACTREAQRFCEACGHTLAPEAADTEPVIAGAGALGMAPQNTAGSIALHPR